MTMKRRKRASLTARWGHYTSRATGETREGVLLERQGKQVAFVTWAEGYRGKGTLLYQRVRAALNVGGGVAGLRNDAALNVADRTRGR